MMLTLYNLPGCPDCNRVIGKLRELNVPFRTVVVPADRRKRTEVYEVSGQYLVPVLVDDGRILIDENYQIERYLEERYGKKNTCQLT